MNYFNLSLAVLLASVLVACDAKRNPYYETEEDAQFKVGDVSVVKAQTKIPPKGQEGLGLPNRKVFNLSACIQDLTGTPVPPKLKFKIQVGKETVDRITNREGCLDWSQEIGFNPVITHTFYVMTVTFIGQAELGGRLNVQIAVNPAAGEVLDLSKRNNTRLEGMTLERYEPEGFIIPNIAKNSFKPVQPDIQSGEVLPSSNVIPTQEANDIRLNIASAELKRIQLSQEEPYSVNTNLDLSVQYTYEFTTSPRFFVKSLDSDEQEIAPRKGNFRITLAIIEEPEFSLTKIWEEINKAPSLRSLINSQSLTPESLALKIAAKKMITNNVEPALTSNNKRKLMAKALLPYVQQSETFDTKLSPQFGLTKEITLSLKKLALLDTRALMAVSVEPLDAEIGTSVKADGAGYISNIANPGGVKIQPWPVEADLLHKERLQAESQKLKLKPLELFFYTSKKRSGDNAFQPLDLSDIPKNAFPNSIGKPSYSIKASLEDYMAGKIRERKALNDFEMSFCYKVYQSPYLKNLPEDDKHSISFSCSANPRGWLNIKPFEFVERVINSKAEREGQTLTQSITVSRGFSIGRAASTNFGSKFDASFSLTGSAGLSAGASTDFLKVLDVKPNPNSPHSGNFGGNANVGMNFSIGKSWYYSSGIETAMQSTGGASSNMGINFNVEMNNFRLQLETRKCLIITIKENVAKYLKSKKADWNEGFVVCSNKTTPRSYVESYYIINQDCPSRSAIADCTSSREQLIRMMIRGREFYGFFEALLKQTDVALMLTKIPQDALRDQVLSWESQFDAFLTSQIFPGAITP